jgi:hypothetical protein
MDVGTRPSRERWRVLATTYAMADIARARTAGSAVHPEWWVAKRRVPL